MGSIGERIRQRRLELGLSQRGLASPGVSYAFVRRIENGNDTPGVIELSLLAPKLGVSVHWLETGEQDPAEELARLVLAHPGQLPARAGELARALLGEDPEPSPAMS